MQKRCVEICRRCDEFQAVPSFVDHVDDVFCRAENDDEDVPLSESQFQCYPLPSGCPFALEHALALQKTTAD